MGEEVEHNCFVCGTYRLHDAYVLGTHLTHRGRYSTGLFAVREDGQIDVLKWKGPITKFQNQALQKLFPQEDYRFFVFHGRYRTRGDNGINLYEGHPHVIGGEVDDRGDHMFIIGCQQALVHNGQIEPRFLNDLNTEFLRTKCDSEALLHYYSQHGIDRVLIDIPDGYTFALADKSQNGVMVARGRHGLKPLHLGSKDGLDCFASETVALRRIGAEFYGNALPGTIYVFGDNGKMQAPRHIMSAQPRHCFFEHTYIGHPDSLIEGAHVTAIRSDLGEQLAREYAMQADLVTYIPESPKHAARAYATARQLPFEEIFYKVDSTRSFQEPTQEGRTISITSNLHLLPRASRILEGKIVICIDDSLVRGTVAKRARDLLYEQGKVNTACILSYTPPIGIIGDDGIPRGCDFGGVDMPSIEESEHTFLARNRSLDEIRREIGIPVHFISRSGMEAVFKNRGLPPDRLCTFCIGGPHPLTELKINGK